LDGVGESFERIVQKELIGRNLPYCFGAMSPPHLTRYITIDTEDILSKKNEVRPDKVYDGDLSVFLRGKKLPEGYVLSEGSIDRIEMYKKEEAINYALRLLACSTCTLFDRCDRISYHYSESIRIEEKIKK
jgi:hypothetical protein